MKLYTEEQVRQAYNVGIINGYSQGNEKENKFIDLISPIKLPSDREIEIAANGNQEHYEGAMWLKYKYLTKTNNLCLKQH